MNWLPSGAEHWMFTLPVFALAQLELPVEVSMALNVVRPLKHPSSFHP